MSSDVMLTTTDNPYDPFTQFDEWYQYDEAKGYCTCGYLARIARTSPELPEEEEVDAIEAAIDDILRINPLGIYKKVVKENT